MLDFPASCWSPKFLDFETNQKKYTKDVISLLEIGHRTSVLNVWVQIPLRSNSLGRWFDKPAVWQRVKREQKIPQRNLISGENDPNKPFTKQQNCQNFLSNVLEPRTRTPYFNPNLSLPDDGRFRIPVAVADECQLFSAPNLVGVPLRLQDLHRGCHWKNIKLYCCIRDQQQCFDENTVLSMPDWQIQRKKHSNLTLILG